MEDNERQPLLQKHTLREKLKADFDDFTEVAVGLILAAAFTKVVDSLVTDIIMPLIGLLPFFEKNLREKFAVLRNGPNAGLGYNTLQQAAEDGALTLAYGKFINNVGNFIGIGLILYLIAQSYQTITKDTIIRRTKRCSDCRKEISQKAKRCAFCTSYQDSRDE